MKFILLLLFSLSLYAQEYLTTLQTRAFEQNLHNHPQWHRLIHYRPTGSEQVESEIDDPKFFLDPSGRSNPQKELNATLASFFAGHFENNSSLDTRCIFTARYRWLSEQLQLDEARLKPIACEAFEHWYRAVKGNQVVLVFPVAFMNNPSSMFGHTFLRLDKNEAVNPLTSYALNYAAATSNDDAITYTIKGLFGGYPGYFSVLPYAEKAKEYNDLENRDIWEYELNLTPGEIDRMLYHAWELHYFYRDYFFFKENCSFILLDLLEYARPRLELTDRFGLWAAPADTVRVLLEHEGMLKDARFRPSKYTQIRHLIAHSNPEVQKSAIALARGKMNPKSLKKHFADQDEQITALDLGLDYSEYLYQEGKTDKETHTARHFKLLVARSELGTRKKPLAPLKVPKRPDQGHPIARAAMGVGYVSENDVKTLNFKIRPSYHNLLDPQAGYVPGAAITFFDLWVQSSESQTRIRQLDLLRIESVAPRDRFFKPIAWRAAGGYRNAAPEERADERGFLEGGPGLAWGEGVLFYLFADFLLEGGGSLEKGRALDGGPSLGILWNPSAHWRARLEASEYHDLLDDRSKLRSLRFNQSLSLDNLWALRLELEHETRGKEHRNEALFWIERFF